MKWQNIKEQLLYEFEINKAFTYLTYKNPKPNLKNRIQYSTFIPINLNEFLQSNIA